MPQLTRRLAHSLELLTLFAISWAVILGAASDLLGFSKEVGAFLAGVSLASIEFRDSIGARLTSLRDFLLLFFFIDLGARLDWSTAGALWGESLIFSLFVLVGNPLIVLIIMGMMGYRRRTSFLAGLTVAQISEFSLIVAALGLSLGHISNETVGLITLVGVVTIFVSTYMILYSGRLYHLLAEPLKVFERDNPFREAAIDSVIDAKPVEVILVGLGNYGSGLAEYLLRRDKAVLGADFDPGALDHWRKRGLPVVYGDITDPEMLEHLPLSKAMWVISTIRSKDMNMSLLTNLKKHGFTGKVALTATTDAEADEFVRAGAHLIFRPFRDATEQAADAIDSALDFLPERVDWPVAFSEVRIRSDASAAGQSIRDLALSSAGISIIAVSRGGQVFYEPDPDFRIFPADRLLVMGPASGLKEAENTLNQMNIPKNAEDFDRFEIAEIKVADESALAGKSVAEIRFRQRYGATLVGIRRGEDQITKVKSSEQIIGGDRLIVIGRTDAVGALKDNAPL